ncbi:hypothetical protein GGQ84_002193 [Desulfitispora alkaliphila]|uniref:hypothetical protein n=1 Tax=Desulfitispora alkaliphila TaxID=622674 RepID=UPI003D2343BB
MKKIFILIGLIVIALLAGCSGGGEDKIQLTAVEVEGITTGYINNGLAVSGVGK